MERSRSARITIEFVNQAGGQGIAVRVDHLDPEQVRSLVARVIPLKRDSVKVRSLIAKKSEGFAVGLIARSEDTLTPAHRLQHQQQFSIRQAAWYAKPLPTFVDAVAVVRQYLWQEYFLLVSLTD